MDENIYFYLYSISIFYELEPAFYVELSEDSILWKELRKEIEKYVW